MAKFTELLEKMHEIKAQISAQLEEAFAEAAQEVFDANPLIGIVRWAQYAPYFNDGEACTFDVHELETGYNFPEGAEDEDGNPQELITDYEYGTKDSAAQEYASWKGFGVSYNYDNQTWDLTATDEEKEHFNEVVRQGDNVLAVIGMFEEFFEELFGDDCKVLIYRDEQGKVVSDAAEFSHD